jgi:Ca2+-binding EF-hand superfamily protein
MKTSTLTLSSCEQVCVKLGQTDEEGKKFCKFDEIVAKVQEAKNTPESSGNYHDYIELLKLYDKNNNGTMMLAELENILANLGDEIPKDDVQKLMAELCDPEDEDGMFPYTPFVDRLCGKA